MAEKNAASTRLPPQEGELATEININVAAIPDYVRDDLADAVLKGFLSFVKQPGGRELLDAKITAKKMALGKTGA